MTYPVSTARPASSVPSAVGPTPTGPEAPHSQHERRRRARRRTSVLVGLALGTLLVFILSLGLGPVSIPPHDTVAVLIDAFRGIPSEIPNALVITELRLPRVLLALIAGAGLAVAGATMQAYFRNPLADPGITGVSSGAAVGAVTVIVLGIDAFGRWTLPLAAFGGALAVLALIQVISAVSRDRSVATVLLVGIAINAFCGAVTGAIVANAEDSQTVRGAMFWLQGDLTSANWNDLALAVLPVTVGILILLGMTREINALHLGDVTAESTGVSVVRVRGQLLVVTSLIIGSVVAVTGVIGFVGLVAPHVVRLLIGSDQRYMLPASALLGASFLVIADTVARLAPVGTSWQTGIVTALVGSPLFLALILRSRRAGWRSS